MGYKYHVQLTQWALASAPRHPILNRMISTFTLRIKELAKLYGGNITATANAGVFKKEDPLKLTGPEAITAAAMEWLEGEAGLRWGALSGLKDGGRSKAVGDTVIFPITAFRYGSLPSLPHLLFSLFVPLFMIADLEVEQPRKGKIRQHGLETCH